MAVLYFMCIILLFHVRERKSLLLGLISFLGLGGSGLSSVPVLTSSGGIQFSGLAKSSSLVAHSGGAESLGDELSPG